VPMNGSPSIADSNSLVSSLTLARISEYLPCHGLPVMKMLQVTSSATEFLILIELRLLCLRPSFSKAEYAPRVRFFLSIQNCARCNRRPLRRRRNKPALPRVSAGS